MTALDLVNAAGNLPSKVYMSVSDSAGAGIKFAFGVDPIQGNDALGTYWDSSLGQYEIVDMEWILTFNFIADKLGEVPVVNFTPEY